MNINPNRIFKNLKFTNENFVRIVSFNYPNSMKIKAYYRDAILHNYILKKSETKE